MRRLTLLLSAPCLALAPASAQQAPPPPPGSTQGSAQGQMAVTIYNNDQALVQDVRTVTVPAGVSRQEFPDVSAQIRPQTVSLSGRGISIVEQNFDYDLLSPRALMEKAVGQTVTLVRTNPATGAETRETARVLANNNGTVVQIGDRVEVLRDDGLPARVIFDRVPPNLRARPTLSVTVEADGAGARPLTLSYLTPGMAWAADYVALFDETRSTIDVQGWITLSNTTGTSYRDAATLLVAGAVGTGGGRRPVQSQPRPVPGGVVGTETADRERLGDFYLYPLPQRTTIANQQQKQVSFLDVAGTPATRGYQYRNAWRATQDDARSASTIFRFSSSRQGGLGDALPAGTVRVYLRDRAGQPQFIGENTIQHTPMGSEVVLRTGEAFDIRVRPVVVERTRLGGDRWRTAMRYTLTNASPRAITVDLVQDGLDWAWGDTRIVEQSLASERLSSNQAIWRVLVPANGEATVTATFETRY